MSKTKSPLKSIRGKNRPVQVRLTPQQHELIEMVVEAGFAKNKTHFCLKAIENQLEKIKILEIEKILETLSRSKS